VTPIPTRYKAKLPGWLSWPVGAQQLTEGLKEVPQLASLSVCFHLHRIAEGDASHPVLTAAHRNVRPGLSGLNFGIERGWYKETWELTVYAVPRERRHRINGLLRDAGLAVVADWLTEPRSETWRDGHHQRGISYSIADDALFVWGDPAK
jgi:hypothetical protein